MSESTCEYLPKTDWPLKITKEQFVELYGSEFTYLFDTTPKDNDDFIANYLSSKLWRLNNLYTITDKDANAVIFNMNHAQHVVYAASLVHPRLIILKSRQQGISTFWLISYFDDAITRPNCQIGLMAQGAAEASTLLKRVGLAWEKFPEYLKQFFNVSLLTDNTNEQGFSNKAIIFIRTSFRSTTLQRLHISEFGKIANENPKRAKETKTGTLQAIKAGNTVIIESTAEGDNDFKVMWGSAVTIQGKITSGELSGYSGKHFMPVFLSWVYDSDCIEPIYQEPSLTNIEYFDKVEALTGVELSTVQRNFWLVQYEELGDSIYQEYPATPEEAFSKTNNGAYYAVAFTNLVERKGRVVKDLYDENLPTYVSMDLGMNDTFVLVYFQKWGSEWRIVDEYSNSGEGLEFYVTKMKESRYQIERVICPHDITVRELGNGMTRQARLRELGVANVKVLPRGSFDIGVESVRTMIPNIWVDERCKHTISAFKNYSKEWDSKRGVWKSSHNHDKHSHFADGIRYMSLSKVGGNSTIATMRKRPRSNGGGMAL